jgi:drug/metabolite transporter (DMT)-like permease
MTGAAVLLVVLSAFAHSFWNYLTKRARNPEVFTWGAALSANVLLLPVAVYLAVRYPPEPIGWAFVAATWCFHVVYFTALSRAYRHADLSLVYPLARGTGLLLIPLLGVLVLGESMSALAIVGVALIAAGVFAVSFGAAGFRRTPTGETGATAAASAGRVSSPSARARLSAAAAWLRQPGVVYAVATGLAISGYSLIDKRGVAYVTPLLYAYLLTSAGTLGMPVVLRRVFTRADVTAEWRLNWRWIVATGLLQVGAYGLVLTALQVSRVSYVAPFREIGIVIGVLMGAFLLDEPFKRGRALGATLIVGGATAIALAP